ncbi:uncharacterized protein [Eucyclogobius newberryi]|uniref:uncharacterized protein n=1 Tax=Eucyclogobius newberryi TaxID=166745 RepID=UPI003B5B1914
MRRASRESCLTVTTPTARESLAVYTSHLLSLPHLHLIVSVQADKRADPSPRATLHTATMQLSALVSFIYVVLLCPPAQTLSAPSTGDYTHTGDAFDPERGEERPHLAKRSILSCDTSFENYCLNKGHCMFIVELNENHCKCELGYGGSRCQDPQLVIQPMKEEQLALIIVFVLLLALGLAGASYVFCKWYRRKQLPQQKHQTYTGKLIV